MNETHPLSFKPTEEQKQAMAQEARTAAEAVEKEFCQAFSKLLEDEEKSPVTEVCNFRYFRFPAIDLSQRWFAKPLGLTGATFSGLAYFGGATFSGGASFRGATFSGETEFRQATFSGEADFSGETFKDECFFIRVILDEKARVVFEKANLKQTSFQDTNLERIHFRDVKWPRKGRRQALWDESPHHEGGQHGYKHDYEKVAENYRQLVLNYEAKRDFDMAEDFH